jgi:hypothetical protein
MSTISDDQTNGINDRKKTFSCFLWISCLDPFGGSDVPSPTESMLSKFCENIYNQTSFLYSISKMQFLTNSIQMKVFTYFLIFVSINSIYCVFLSGIQIDLSPPILLSDISKWYSTATSPDNHFLQIIPVHMDFRPSLMKILIVKIHLLVYINQFLIKSVYLIS